jgi:hypothetical protein
MTANKSLQATRDGALSSASRFTSFGPACLSSGRYASMFCVVITIHNQTKKGVIQW